MNELIVDILDTFKQQGIYVNPQAAQLALEIAIINYNVTPKSCALALTSDMMDKAYYFVSCKRLDGLQDTTLKNYMYTLRQLSYYITKPVDAISTIDLRYYISEKSKYIAAGTVESIVWCFKSFFGWLHDEGYISADPSKKLNAPKRSKHIRTGLTVEQIEMCRNACETPRERAMFEFFLASGCRVSEVLGLKVDDVLSGQYIVFGKGSKERFCYLNSKAKMYLKMYLKSREGDSDLLFTIGKAPYRQISRRSIEEEIANIGLRCGLKVYPHLLRHTFACMTLEAGASLKAVQELLGHTNVSTTEIYAKLSNTSIKHEYMKYVAI